MEPLLKVLDLNVRYAGREKKALADVTFELRKGEVLLLAGPTGSGKSTLCLTICGLIPRLVPAEVKGEILLEGRRLWDMKLHEQITTVNMLLQDPEVQLTSFSVDEEVKFALENLGLPENEVALRCTWALKVVDGSRLSGRYVDEISYGEKQKVALASVLALRPELLILDEPLSHQDYPSRRLMIGLLRKLRSEGFSIIIAEHRIDELKDLVDRVIALHSGRAVFEGDVKSFLNSDISRALGLRGVYALKQVVRRREERRGKDVLSVRGLSYSYGKVEVLRRVSFDVSEGKRIFIVGPNGAGKSTLGMCLAGLLKPASGSVRVMGRDVHKLGWGERIRLIGYVFQNPDLMLTSDTVLREVEFGLENLGLKGEELRKRALDVLKVLHIEHLKDEDPHMLSRGERMLVAIASMMAFRPKVLILDEPFSGQDGKGVVAIFSLVERLREMGITVLIITHDLDIAYTYADEVIALKEGTKIAQGPPERVIEFLYEGMG